MAEVISTKITCACIQNHMNPNEICGFSSGFAQFAKMKAKCTIILAICILETPKGVLLQKAAFHQGLYRL